MSHTIRPTTAARACRSATMGSSVNCSQGQRGERFYKLTDNLCNSRINSRRGSVIVLEQSTGRNSWQQWMLPSQRGSTGGGLHFIGSGTFPSDW